MEVEARFDMRSGEEPELERAQRHYDVNVEWDQGEHRSQVVVRGDYSEVMRLMTQHLGMDEDEAHDYIDSDVNEGRNISPMEVEARFEMREDELPELERARRQYDVTIGVERPKGWSETHVVVRGSYDEVMRLMTEFLGMSDAEADTYVDSDVHEGRNISVSFDRFMDAVVEREDAARQQGLQRLEEAKQETWGRLRDRREREHPLSRMRVSGK